MWKEQISKKPPQPVHIPESFVIHIGHREIRILEWWSWFYWTYSLINDILCAIVVYNRYTEHCSLFIAVSVFLWFLIGIYPCFVTYLLSHNYTVKIRNWMIFVICMSFIDFGVCIAVSLVGFKGLYADYLKHDRDWNQITDAIHILTIICVVMSFLGDFILLRMVYLDIQILMEWKKAIEVHDQTPSSHNEQADVMHLSDK
eukprot:619200_1